MPGSESAECLRAVALRWMDLIWQQRTLDAVDELHAPDFVDRSTAGRQSDNAAYKAGIAELYAAFPDWQATADDLVVDAAVHKVAVRWTAVGTHAAPFMGRAATNRRIVFTGIEIIKIRDGLIAERWGEWDGIALLAQLDGATPL